MLKSHCVLALALAMCILTHLNSWAREDDKSDQPILTLGLSCWWELTGQQGELVVMK